MHAETQPAASGISRDELSNYDLRIIVAGSRGFDDYVLFSHVMGEYTHELALDGKRPVFLSGMARSGADAMIIKWCKEFGFPWCEFPADWDDITAPDAIVRERPNGKKYNVVAGFNRNQVMANSANRLIIFWDGISPGTKDMSDRMHELKHPVRTILVDKVHE